MEPPQRDSLFRCLEEVTQKVKVGFILEDSGNVYFVSQSYLVILLLNNVCANIYVSFLKKYFLQIDAKEHGSGGQGGAEAGAGSGPRECSAESEPTWVNCLVGRIFWDFLREKYWADQVAHKIQKKLSKIKVRVYENVCKLGVF